MILSSVSETLLRILAKINLGNISDYMFQCSSVLFSSFQFISTAFKKPKAAKQFHLREIELEEEKIVKLEGKEYHLCIGVIKYVKAKRKKTKIFV